eukprot:SAG31_NODE_300_length_18109_cov_47.887285_7_plen_166_part_00
MVDNHPALAADIGVFLYALAGVEPDSWGLGQERRLRFQLDPTTARTIGAAEVDITGVLGSTASFSWAFSKREGKHTSFWLNASVPHGEDAELHLPLPHPISQCHSLHMSNYLAWTSCMIDDPSGSARASTAASLGLRSLELAAEHDGSEKLVAIVGSGNHSFLLL